MSRPDEPDTPLQEEAKARPEWREGETILGKSESGPASEMDDAAQGGAPAPADPLVQGLAGRPPD